MDLNHRHQQQARLSASHAVVPEAHEAFLKGKHFANRLSPDSLEKAVRYFNDAIKADPTYAPAYAELAETYGWATASQFIPSQEGLAKAKSAALHALEIDPNLGEAYNTLAWVKYVHDWDFEGADQDFERALALSTAPRISTFGAATFSPNPDATMNPSTK